MASEPSDDVDMAPAEPTAALPADVLRSIDDTASALSSERRARMKRAAPEGYTTPATAASLAEQTAITSLHGASAPGISAMDVSANGALVLTGGKDKSVLVLDRASQKVVSTFKGHTKPVSAVVFSGRCNPPVGAEAADVPNPTYAASASADKTVRVYHVKGEKYALAHTLKGYQGEVVGVDIHPTDELVGSASADRSWALHALASGERLLHVEAPDEDDEGGFAYASFAFHPDGQLAATGTAEGAIRIWDVKQGKQSAVFRGHLGAVHTLHFSPNGYWLAAAARDTNEVKVWDLRKLAVARTLTLPDNHQIDQVRFDATGQLLAVAGTDVRAFGGKTLEPVLTFDGNTAEVTGVQWSPVDGALVCAGLDRTVRVLAAGAEH